MTASKTQVDKLGERLKKGALTEADLRLLDEYRRSFVDAYEIVIGKLRNDLGLEPTGRPAKSTTSIIEKLRRESIRLTQMQDIAGCRLTVTNPAEQDQVIELLKALFENAEVVDRRQRPSHSYRAVHVIVDCDGKLVEIQVRTFLQHRWAELSEKLSDRKDSTIKYGGGDKESRDSLVSLSESIADVEFAEMEVVKLNKRLELVNNSLPFVHFSLAQRVLKILVKHWIMPEHDRLLNRLCSSKIKLDMLMYNLSSTLSDEKNK